MVFIKNCSIHVGGGEALAHRIGFCWTGEKRAAVSLNSVSHRLASDFFFFFTALSFLKNKQMLNKA